MENLVFSSGYGYPRTYLTAFLKSISRNMKTADVILFYHDSSEESVSYLRKYLDRVRVIKPSDHLVRRTISILPRRRKRITRSISSLARKLDNSQPYSPLLTATYHATLARYFWVTNYCDRVDISQYRRLMLCDSRDVVIQNDAFDKANDISFVTGREERLIEECSLNQHWIYQCYGADVV